MNTFYILVDCDDHLHPLVFRQRRNAIQYAYEHCNSCGARLFVSEWDPSGEQWRYTALPCAVGNNDPIEYLCTLNNAGVNDVFYEYYFLTEANFEDAEIV